MSLPLDGVRVLDLSRLLPGGYCSQLLSDFGADVIKVEDTGQGDYVRWMGPRYEGAEPSAAAAMFLAWNRGKRSIQLNLKSDAGRDAFLKLATETDVVLESFRPGVMARLGVGYDELKRVNPRLIYCAISGYGQDGPCADRSGHDLNYLARTGILDLSGELDGPPVQPATQIADIGGGAQSALSGILLALLERERSGEGQLVDASMFDGALAWAASVASRYFCDGRVPERGTLDLRGGVVCYLPYPCRDGWVTLGALEPKFWEAFCRGIGREDLLAHQMDPSDGWAQGQLEHEFRKRTRAEWEQFSAEHDCCLEVVLSIDEALAQDLVKQRGLVVELEQPGTDGVRGLAPTPRLSRTPGDPGRRPAPALGEHTRQVLGEAGYSHDELARLRSEGAIGA